MNNGDRMCRNVETSTDVSLRDFAGLDLLGGISQPTLLYKLRASTSDVNSPPDGASVSAVDLWTPLLSPSFDGKALSPQQIDKTLDYLLLGSKRVRQMTKTYNDAEAVSRLLLDDLRHRNCPCSLMAIQTKALTLFEDLKKKEASSAESETFTPSRGWFERFKKRYELRNVQMTGSDGRYTLKEFWRGYHIMNAVQYLAAAWHEVKRSTMNLAWRKICPEAIAELTVLGTTIAACSSGVSELAHEVGFSDINEEDILELIESHDEELSNKDLMEMEQQLADEEENDKTEDPKQARTLTTKDLSEAFQLLDRAKTVFTEKGPQRERSAEREKDLELAAKIGKTLLERNHELQLTNELLEERLNSANDQVTQLKHDLQQKVNLLQMVTDEDDDLSSLTDLQKKLKLLEEENSNLKLEANHLKSLTESLEEREQQLISDCVRQLSESSAQLGTVSTQLSDKSDALMKQQGQISNLLAEVNQLHQNEAKLCADAEELRCSLYAARETQAELSQELIDLQERYAEVLNLLGEARDEIKNLRQQKDVKYADSSNADSLYGCLASELEASISPRGGQKQFAEGMASADNMHALSSIAVAVSQKVPESENPSIVAVPQDPESPSSLPLFNQESLNKTSNSTYDSSTSLAVCLELTGQPTCRRPFEPGSPLILQFSIPLVVGFTFFSMMNSFVHWPHCLERENDNDMFTDDGTQAVTKALKKIAQPSRLGVPGLPGTNDLEKAIQRLTLRRQTELRYRQRTFDRYLHSGVLATSKTDAQLISCSVSTLGHSPFDPLSSSNVSGLRDPLSSSPNFFLTQRKDESRLFDTSRLFRMIHSWFMPSIPQLTTDGCGRQGTENVPPSFYSSAGSLLETNQRPFTLCSAACFISTVGTYSYVNSRVPHPNVPFSAYTEKHTSWKNSTHSSSSKKCELSAQRDQKYPWSSCLWNLELCHATSFTWAASSILNHIPLSKDSAPAEPPGEKFTYAAAGLSIPIDPPKSTSTFG
ncbi:hypothetical protein M514_00928 [Trichuris suis]|uniref:HTH CENPB-type domain-containing protein n=1 Tax=Trichuris suis TaxID=68888 RepID=A0A085MWE1_9BILA|nr:hypothetical protein M514_00928 [Trichuris suis]